MTLPASQQHALDAIDDVLQSAEPRLATMFGVFTDLTRLEAMPAVETLPPGRWWTRYRLPGHRYRPGRPHHSGRRRADRRLGRIVLVPLLLVAAVSLLIVSLISAGPSRAARVRSGRGDGHGSPDAEHPEQGRGDQQRGGHGGRQLPHRQLAARHRDQVARCPAAGPG